MHRLFFLTALTLAISSCRPLSSPHTGTPSHPNRTKTTPAVSLSPDLSPISTNPTSAATASSEDETADPISEVLSADLTPGETSSRLLALLPTTPPDDQSFLVQIAGNYCPDEEYWRMLPFLLNRNLPEDCREELLRDVLRRPDAIRLRPLYRLALDPTHPLSQEAKEYLFAYLQDVPENDFNALAREVDKAEKENR